MAAAAWVVVASLGLAGCGQKVIVPGGAQKVVTDVVSRQTGFVAPDVNCPSGVDAKVGGTFQCHFTGPAGVKYTAYLKITSVQGSRVLFYVKTRPSG